MFTPCKVGEKRKKEREERERETKRQRQERQRTLISILRPLEVILHILLLSLVRFLRNIWCHNGCISCIILPFFWFILALPGLFNASWTTTRRKLFFICIYSRSGDHFAPCCLFRLAMSAYQFTFTHCYFHVHIYHCNITLVLNVAVVAYDKKWENRVMPSHHDQATLDIRLRCSPKVLTSTASTLGQHLCRISSSAWSWLSEQPFNQL